MSITQSATPAFISAFRSVVAQNASSNAPYSNASTGTPNARRARQSTQSVNHVGIVNDGVRSYGVIGGLMTAWRSNCKRTRWVVQPMETDPAALCVVNTRRTCGQSCDVSDQSLLGEFTHSLPASLLRQMGLNAGALQSMVEAGEKGGWNAILTWIDNNLAFDGVDDGV